MKFQRPSGTRLSEALFRHPTAEYRGAPFWSWNERLNLPRLLRQLPMFAEMGFGGAHVHCRTGTDTAYLGEEFLEIIAQCTDAAKRQRLLLWLYDEDRWPSGYAGGLVTADPQHRVKYLLFTATPYNGTIRKVLNEGFVRGAREENGQLLACYGVTLAADGTLARYRRVKSPDALRGRERLWCAYLETGDPIPWFNRQTYVDSLSPAAIERFVEVTHERFKAKVGGAFGRTIPAMFTDEPQHLCLEHFAHPHQARDLTIPFTGDFCASYRAAYGVDFLETLPELFWELPDQRASVARYRYHDHKTQRFAEAFARTVGRWCEANNLLLTGHMMQEPTLSDQTGSTGEAMRSLAHFHVPGIDMLCDDMELTTAKQAQSIARQFGRSGTMSEIYGVTGWDFDFVGHKAQGDWQAALGVTLRVPHLSWVSMAGDAKRDFPASIFYQSPWWREYRLVEDYFSRLNTVLTRGRPAVRVAVIHPIESFWLSYGPTSQTGGKRDHLEQSFAQITDWLLRGLVDFDYLSEALLPTQSRVRAGKQLRVGAMAYDAVIVPNLATIRRSTLDRLEAFAAAGGRVIFAGKVPTLVDAEVSGRGRALAQRACQCGWDRTEILEALAPFRTVTGRTSAGALTTTLFYQLRVDGQERHLFICHTDRLRPLTQAQLTVAGAWQVVQRDAMNGTARPVFSRIERGHTIIEHDFAPHGSVLFTLQPRKRETPPPAAARVWKETSRLDDLVPVTLAEPNSLLLDQAEWRWENGPWQPREELLRLEALARSLGGLPVKNGYQEQPWADPDPVVPVGRLSLRFTVQSDVAVSRPELALETPAAWQIELNGRRVPNRARGWWVDEAIRRVPLPALKAGTHTLVLSTELTRRTNVEWVHLLGDFGVTLTGRHARLSAPVRQLAFGDWTRQGLPFYGGNVTYHCATTGHGRSARLQFPQFKAPLLKVALDRQPGKPVAFAPFELELGRLSPRRHRLDITAFGNRFNSFGTLHNLNPFLRWIGPEAWRTAGSHWTYEYQLRPMGVLSAPCVLEA